MCLTRCRLVCQDMDTANIMENILIINMDMVNVMDMEDPMEMIIQKEIKK